jgi:MFS family permease
MQTVAVGVLVTATTGRPGWTGLVAAAGFLPTGLLSPLGGVLADRFDRRRWLFATTVGETAFASVLAVLSSLGRPGPAVVTLLVFGGGAMAAVGFPAYQSMLPDLVPPAELGSAISLSSAQFNLGRVIGPALAGIAVVAGGYPWAFGINAGSFFAVLVALRLVRLPPVAERGDETTLLRRLVEGGRATLEVVPARFAVGAISVVALTASPFIALVPAFALQVFDAKASGTSVLVTAQGVGAVAGALGLTPLVRKYGRRPMLAACLLVVCAALAGYALSPGLWIGAVFLAVVGAAYIGVLAGLNTIVQLHAPGTMRGRMLGIYMMALGILYPVGAVVQGSVANAVGLRTVTVAGAALLALAVVAALRSGVFPADLEASCEPVSEPTVTPEPPLAEGVG